MGNRPFGGTKWRREELALFLSPLLVLCWLLARRSPPPDTLNLEMRRLAGPNATDCGTGASSTDRRGWEVISDCAEACFLRHQPFYMRDNAPSVPKWAVGNKYHVEQWVTSRAYSPDGRLYFVSFSKYDKSSPVHLDWVEGLGLGVSHNFDLTYPHRIVATKLVPLSTPPPSAQ